MAFPTVAECADLSGAKRELLHEFDQQLRDALCAAQRKARRLALTDQDVETACVTVMMTVAAGAALESQADGVDAHFSAAARDALIWARRRAGALAARCN